MVQSFVRILLSVMAFYIGGVAARKARTPIANPLLIAMVICVLVLKILHISYDDYMEGAQFVSMFLVPVTAMLDCPSTARERCSKSSSFLS